MIGGAGDALPCEWLDWPRQGAFLEGLTHSRKTKSSNQGWPWDSLCGQQGRAENSADSHPFPGCVSVKNISVLLVLASVTVLHFLLALAR